MLQPGVDHTTLGKPKNAICLKVFPPAAQAEALAPPKEHLCLMKGENRKANGRCWSTALLHLFKVCPVLSQAFLVKN